MTLQECYEVIGGNYEDVLKRLRSADQEIHVKIP